LKGWAVWLTGLPGCGKSTVARILAESLRESDIPVQILSLDMLRKVITPRPTYSDEERKIVYGALVFATRLLTENGVNVLIDATANRRGYRAEARRQISLFIEAYLKCPLEVCIDREAKRRRTHGAPRHIYSKGMAGRSENVPGLGAPYEEPTNPEVTVETGKLNSKQSAEEILTTIKERFKLDINL